MTITLLFIMTLVIAASYWLEEPTKWVAHISGVLLLIMIAVFLGSTGIVPSKEENYSLIFKWGVPLGIILMLLAFDPRQVLKIRRNFIICFAIGAAGTAIGGIIAGLVFKQFLPNDYWRVSGQLTASFIGGYENAVAVGTSLNTPIPVFLTVFAGDSILTTLWIIVNIYQGRNIIHPKKMDGVNPVADSFSNKIDLTSFSITILAATAILLASYHLNILIAVVPKIIWASILATLLTFTSLRARFGGSYIIGSFVLSFFFFACGAVSDVVSLFNSGTILLLFPALIVGVHAMILFGFSRLFNLEKDITILASQALIGGPATALAVVSARKWNFQFEAIVLGLLGYAIGNYFGFGVAWLLYSF